MSLTVAQARLQGVGYLSRFNLPNPCLDVDLLLSTILKCEKLRIITDAGRELTSAQRKVFARAIEKRGDFVPIPYLTKRAWFYGRSFAVNKNVLVPRPETEDLVKLVVDYCALNSYVNEIIEPCTGSGAIGVTLALEIGNLVKSSDISRGALLVARYNAKKFAAPVKVAQTDFLGPDVEDVSGKVLVINPPYIQEDFAYTHLDSLPLKHEPAEALFIDDGLTFYRRIRDLVDKQRPKAVFCEINEEHARELLELFAGVGSDRKIVKDGFGMERIFSLEF